MHPLRVALVIFLILTLGYALFEARLFLAGPELTLATPAQGTTTKTGIITVSGRVLREVAFSINGKKVLPDKNGSFTKTFVFPKGESLLTVEATDRFGHTVTDTRMIFAR